MAAPTTPRGDIMTQHISNHVLDGKGLNFDDYSFSVGSISGATQLKLKDVLNSRKINKKINRSGCFNGMGKGFILKR